MSEEVTGTAQEVTQEATTEKVEQDSPIIDVDALEQKLEQAELSAAKYKKNFEGIKEKAKSDRLGLLKEFGISADDILDDIIGTQDSSNTQQADTSNIPKEFIEKMNKLESYVSGLQEREKNITKQQADAQVLGSIRDVIGESEDKYERAKIFGDHAAVKVKSMIEAYTNEYGVRPRKKQIEAFIRDVDESLQPELEAAAKLLLESKVGRKALGLNPEVKPTLTNSDSGGTRDYSDISDLPPEQKIIEVAKRLRANQ